MDEAKRRTATTYNAASDHYDDTALSFWERFGRATVERLELLPGARVLDVCSGTGASAIPAAQRAGTTGRVMAIDLSDKLIAIGRSKAEQLGISKIEFRPGDFEDMELSQGGFDAVVCVFGIFFLPDMVRGVRSLWRAVKPGGQLAITTWGPRLFEPANGTFWEGVRAERPELCNGSNPWDTLAEPEGIRSLFRSAGIEAVEVVSEEGTHTLRSPEDWWMIVMGSQYRATVERMTPDQRERVRMRCEAFLRARGVRQLTANVVYAVARRP